jgi:fructose-1,6-bisphosphatase I
MTKTTLANWLSDQVDHGNVPEDLASVVASVASACVELAGILRNAPSQGLVGALESINVQGETQKQLDVIANDIFIKNTRANPAIAVLVSEELDEALLIDNPAPAARYGLVFDPLDGSSNLDVNVTVGSIFSIIKVDPAAPDLLQAGTRQLAAGYAAYGPSTSIVLTFGKSTDAFTLNTDTGVFELVQAGLRVPEASAEYAINTSRFRFWDAPTRAYVEACVAGETGPFGKRYNMRWVGSMVADIHRILTRGGIFLYPSDSETAAKGGRLRLLYEANPMSMIIEAAGGAASTGTGRILELRPKQLHQRVPVILGSAAEVRRFEECYR